MKTLIGIVTFGNLPFTQLTIDSIRERTTRPVDLFIVVGKPGDEETIRFLEARGIPFVFHGENQGFPASLNDIYDYAWGRPEPYDNLVIAGNDVVPYPGAIDALIEVAEGSDWEWVCSSQFDVKSLCEHYPNARQYFEGDTYVFNRWGKSLTQVDYWPAVRPWDWHADKVPPARPEGIQPDCIKDVRNLCLFKRSVFDKIGYADANFWPGGYFEDNDYCTRARKAGIRACGVAHSAYFHFWSRTIHQGSGSTTSRHFQNNARYYGMKWGGSFDHEAYDRPFEGHGWNLGPEDIVLPGSLKISNRKDERRIIEYWRNKAAQ